jgi:putative membrane protein
MTRTNLILSIAAAMAIAACGNSTDLEEQGTLSEPGAPATAAGSAPATADADFLGRVLTAGLKEVELGRLAEAQATRPEVKEFARMVVQEHQQVNDRVRQIVGDAGLTVTPDGEPLQEARDRIASLTGIEFDREYIDMMVESHEDSVELVEGKAVGDSSSAVRTWATDTLPTLRRHLQRAQEIQRLIAGVEPGSQAASRVDR